MSRRSSSTPIARTEASIKSHRAVNTIFAGHAAKERKVTQDRLAGRTWSTAHSGPIAGGLRAMFTPSQLKKLSEEGKFVDESGNVVDSVPSESFSHDNKSCYLLNAQKQFHSYSRDDPDANKRAMQNERYSYAEALHEYNKAQAIIRHERTIPKRRIIDRYVQLTSAQVDLHQEVPNRSAIRNRVRQHEGWVLANPDRQELHKGKPLMSRVMAGEFYYENGNLGALANDFVAINKQHVRTASAVSRVANGHAPVAALPEYSSAPQPRRLVATLKTYDPSEEARVQAQRGRAHSAHGGRASPSSGHPSSSAYHAPQNDPLRATRIPIGHRHYNPHRTEGITLGAKVAQRVIRPVSCDHSRDRCKPLYDPHMMGSDTYVPTVWPPQPAAPQPHALSHLHAQYHSDY